MKKENHVKFTAMLAVMCAALAGKGELSEEHRAVLQQTLNVPAYHLSDIQGIGAVTGYAKGHQLAPDDVALLVQANFEREIAEFEKTKASGSQESLLSAEKCRRWIRLLGAVKSPASIPFLKKVAESDCPFHFDALLVYSELTETEALPLIHKALCAPWGVSSRQILLLRFGPQLTALRQTRPTQAEDELNLYYTFLFEQVQQIEDGNICILINNILCSHIPEYPASVQRELAMQRWVVSTNYWTRTLFEEIKAAIEATPPEKRFDLSQRFTVFPETIKKNEEMKKAFQSMAEATAELRGKAEADRLPALRESILNYSRDLAFLRSTAEVEARGSELGFSTGDCARAAGELLLEEYAGWKNKETVPWRNGTFNGFFQSSVNLCSLLESLNDPVALPFLEQVNTEGSNNLKRAICTTYVSIAGVDALAIFREMMSAPSKHWRDIDLIDLHRHFLERVAVDQASEQGVSKEKLDAVFAFFVEQALNLNDSSTVDLIDKKLCQQMPGYQASPVHKQVVERLKQLPPLPVYGCPGG
jgi:hypothetical protein